MTLYTNLKNIFNTKNIIQQLSVFLLLFVSIFLFSFTAEASGFDITRDPCEGKDSCLSYIDNEDLPDAIQVKDDETLSQRVVKLINQVLMYMGLVLTIIVIYAGLVIIFSLGDNEGISSAKNMIINAIIGIVIIVLSYSIVYAIGHLMRLDDSGNNGTIGTQGGNGTIGTQGNNGTIGTQGNNGTIGTQGNNGTIGTQGGNGTIGTQGGNGTIGTQGNNGTIGTQGGNGTIGTQGNNGTIGTQGNNGTIGTQGYEGEIGVIEGEIAELGTKKNQLESNNKNGKNDNKIEELNASIKALENDKYNKSLEYKIKTLEEEMALLQSKKDNITEGSSDNSEKNNEEIAKLKNELLLLRDKLESGVFDTNEELNKILKEVKNKDNLDIKKLQKVINSLKKNSGNNSNNTSNNNNNNINDNNQNTQNKELLEKYNNLQDLFNKLEDNPTNTVILKEIEKEVAKTKEVTKKFSEIKPSILLQSSRSTTPTKITLSAEKTVIKGKSSVMLSNDNYHWSVVGPDGVLQKLGNGMVRVFTVTVPGRYIFTLHVSSTNENILSGTAKKAVTIKEPNTESLFMVGGKTMNETIAFTQEQNVEGIIFNPSLTKPKVGREIVKYIWNFDGIRKEEKEGRSLLYTFPKEGKYKVSLEVEDNIGERTRSEKITVEIKKIVSYFSLKKYEYNIGEVVKFKGGKSVSSGGYIQEYDWKVLNVSGELLAEFQSQDFDYSFEKPGEYFIKLEVKDAEERISVFSKSVLIIAKNPIPKFTVKNTEKENPAQRFFDAKKSSDPAESVLKYSWDFDGDGVYEKTNLETSKIEYIFPKAKEYTVVLKVENQFGKSEVLKKKIEILSTLSAKIETKGVVYPMNTKVEFNIVSNDGVVFEWDFGDGSKEILTSESFATHKYTESGRYIISVLVRDAEENKITAKKSVFIGVVESPTSAISIFVDGKLTEVEEDLCGSGKHGIEMYRSQKIEFSAENSVNKDGKTSSLDYLWKFPDNTKESDKKIFWKFQKVSKYGKCEKISLEVVDQRSNKKSNEESIYVFVKNTKPEILNFSLKNPKTKISPLSVGLSMKAKDFDGKIMKYSWWAERSGDGNHKKIGFHNTQASYTTLTIPSYGEEGEEHEYSFYGSVIDSNDTEVFTKDEFGKIPPVFVITDKNRQPKLEIISSSKTILLGDTVTFTVLVKTPEGLDISHLPEYSWDFNNDNIFDKTTSTNKVVHKYNTFGKKEIRVKVLYQGLVTSDIIKIEVEKVSKLPLAIFKVQKSGILPEEIYFNAESSIYDKTISGNAIEYIWDIDTNYDSDGDGKSDNDVDYKTGAFTHTYPHGKLDAEILLKVKDAENSEDILRRKINFNKLSGIISHDSEDSKKFQALLSEKSSEKIKDVQENLDAILKEKREISQKEVNNISNLVTALDVEIQDTDYLHEDVVEMKALLSDLKETPEDKVVLLELKELISKTIKSSNNYNLSKWKPVNMLDDNINSSLIIEANAPSSQLNLYGGEAFLKDGETIEIFAFIQNVDGSLYSGDLNVKILEGAGELSSKSIKSIDGRAIFTFTPSEMGVAKLEVEAVDTLSGSLTETLQFIIQE